ncbi:Uncharacterised protein [Achromobacter xylosoxidans]|nr:Uncharacterised protein [Achromobacter xylosoxidans]
MARPGAGAGAQFPRRRGVQAIGPHPMAGDGVGAQVAQVDARAVVGGGRVVQVGALLAVRARAGAAARDHLRRPLRHAASIQRKAQQLARAVVRHVQLPRRQVDADMAGGGAGQRDAAEGAQRGAAGLDGVDLQGGVPFPFADAVEPSGRRAQVGRVDRAGQHLPFMERGRRAVEGQQVDAAAASLHVRQDLGVGADGEHAAAGRAGKGRVMHVRTSLPRRSTPPAPARRP